MISHRTLFEILRVLLCLIAYIAVCFIFYLLIGFFYHTYMQERVTNRIQKVIHPTGSYRLSLLGKVGQYDNSEECDYQVVEVRASDLPHDVVRKYYNSVSVPTINSLVDMWIDVYFLDSYDATEYSEDPIFKHLEMYPIPIQDKQHAYALYYLNIGSDIFADYRCL